MHTHTYIDACIHSFTYMQAYIIYAYPHAYIHTYIFIYYYWILIWIIIIYLYSGLVLVRGGFCPGFCLRVFVWKVFCPFPLLSEYMYIRYNRKLNITLIFRFHIYVYDKDFSKHVLLTLPMSQTVIPSPTHPLERDVLYERPLSRYFI